MAVTASTLTSGSSSTNATSYTTASVSPGASKLVLLAVQQSLVTVGSPASPTITGFTEIAAVNHYADGGNFYNRLSLFRYLNASPFSGTRTIDFGAVTQDSCAWSMYEFDGIDTSGTNGSGAIVQNATNSGSAVSSLSATLAAFGSANNATYGAFGGVLASATSITFTPGTGFSELHDTGTEYTYIGTQWRNDNDTSVDSTFSEALTGAAVIAVEIKAAASPKGLILLMSGDGGFM